jgi:hypothetical protein
MNLYNDVIEGGINIVAKAIFEATLNNFAPELHNCDCRVHFVIGTNSETVL